MRNLFLLLLSSLILANCGGGKETGPAHFPPGTIIEQRKSDKETRYYYPPPKPIEQKSTPPRAFPRFAPTEKPVKIALLVPLSGKFEELGKNMLDAAQLALFRLRVPGIKLLPFDTKGTSFGAVDATKEAIGQDVNLILGPVFGKSAVAIAPIASEAGISVVSFSNDRSLAGKGIFAMGFLPEQQIKRVLEYAIEQGIHEYSAVLENNTYGAIIAKELRETIEQEEEAAVLKTEIYRVDKKGKPLKLKSHVFAAYNAALRNRSPKDFDEELKQFNEEPIQYPRGLLIPKGDDSLKKKIALLEKYNFEPEKVRLLGSSQWYNDKVLYEPLLEGAWFAATPKIRRKQFQTSFEQVYGYSPVRLASLAYDGIALAATLSRISEESDFGHSALTNPRGFVGVDGIFRFTEDGLTERGLAVIEVSKAGFKIIDQSPQSFFEVVRHAEDNIQHDSMPDGAGEQSQSPGIDSTFEGATSDQLPDSGMQPTYEESFNPPPPKANTDATIHSEQQRRRPRHNNSFQEDPFTDN